ncbi:hypothetical protein K435DRAFT_961933 [Dendrothele bispora CBS 962.96]|uniref:Uncharacterized protein n=1 Tax=Dendrothele bispora (strain CBS 962.96) TaxID=1314807 RepID=A0A4S8MN33_DENBC|nr:hypothetical protein K435DRAFT_961933 [Dendrothele bispora CBS 962.96]
MPAAKKALLAGFEEYLNDSKKVRCAACFSVDPIKNDGMLRSSMKDHIITPKHQESLERIQDMEERARQQKQLIQDIYSGELDVNMQDFSGPEIHQQPSMSHHTQLPTFPMSFTEPIMEPLPNFDVQAEHENLASQIEQLRLQSLFSQDEDDPAPDTETNVEQILRALGYIDDDALGEDESMVLPSAADNADWAPYPNKLGMLLDLVDNLPRLRLSSAHFKLILWLLKECGVSQVPSYSAFRKMQGLLTDVCGSKPKHFKSLFNNHFYVNDPKDAIKRNFANLHVAGNLNFYPEISSKGCTPMYSNGGKQFYIHEVALLRDKRIVIPIAWIKREGGKIFADANLVTIGENGLWTQQNDVIVVSSDLFDRNCLDILDSLPLKCIPWEVPDSVPTMPNPDRELVPEGYDLYDVHLATWFDDVSGNRSKQYNKHFVGYAANTNLPGKLLQQEFFVEYLSNSQHATALEQLSAIKDLVNESQKKPIICYNASTRRMCGVRLHITVLPADNPQQSEEASHMGGGANHMCRKCNVGGPSSLVETNEGYHSLYLAAEDLARSAAETRSRLEKQLKAAMTGVKQTVTDMQTATGTKDKFTEYWIELLIHKSAELTKENRGATAEQIVKDLEKWLNDQPGEKMNPLLDIAGLDPTKDTPVEILHTILLGIVKYVWHMFNTSLTDKQKSLFVIRLQSTDIDGLAIPPLRADYMMQYRNNLIGKHFKTLMQTMAFHVHDIVTPAQFSLIKAVGELAAVLWVSEIADMDQYLADLDILIANTLDAFAEVDPLKIIQKVKLHLLPHLISDIRRFGPPVRYSTEIFECFNAIFRLCSIYSNHQAPSRDIALKFTSMARVKHIFSGGYWLQENKWVQASPKVRRLLETDVTIQRHLGWVPPDIIQLGYMKPLAQAKTVPRLWSSTNASTVCVTPPEDFSHWNDNRSVISQAGDVCKIGSWVITRRKGETSFEFGRISELLSPSIDRNSASVLPEKLVTVERFILGDKLHTEFNMPILHQPETPSFFLVKTDEIVCRISVQHDCQLHKCAPTGSRPITQERLKTERTQTLLTHEDDNHFVINMHALHNASLVRNILPRVLIAPRLLHGTEEEREAWHGEIVENVRPTMVAKRKKANEKRQETREANQKKKKQKKALITAGQPSLYPEVDEDAEERDTEERNEAEPAVDESDENEISRPQKRKR